MRIESEYGFIETRESVLLRAIMALDNLTELEREGVVVINHPVSDTFPASVCHTLTNLAIREALRLDELSQLDIISDLEAEPVTSGEVKALLSRPLGEYLSFQVG